MNSSHFDKYVADMAKEIVVAKMSNTTLSVNEESGKHVADYYREIYNGIYATLRDTAINAD